MAYYSGIAITTHNDSLRGRYTALLTQRTTNTLVAKMFTNTIAGNVRIDPVNQASPKQYVNEGKHIQEEI